jgi:hypothetical protein
MDVTLELVPDLAAAIDHIHQHGSGHTGAWCVCVCVCVCARVCVCRHAWGAAQVHVCRCSRGWLAAAAATNSLCCLPVAAVLVVRCRGDCH